MTTLLTTKGKFGIAPRNVGPFDFIPPTKQMILRMMVREKGGKVLLPECLTWLKTIVESVSMINDWYIYVTVRSGIVNTSTDDEWHVDGFSMRVPHPPEINFIWSDNNPTEFFVGDLRLPDDFDPFQHNIHHFFQDIIGDQPANFVAEERVLYLIDPYVVHRRPTITQGTQRTFFRVSLVPVEIEDDTCMSNPLMQKRVYNRPDIRQVLKRYPVDQT